MREHGCTVIVPADRGVWVHASSLVAAIGASGAALRDPPGVGLVLASAVLAASLTVAFWWLFGHAVTLAHEGGHALTAVLLGGVVTRMELRLDQTGATWSATGPLRRLGVLLTGYTGPSIFGLTGAVLLRNGRADLVLWGSVLLLAWALTVTRNWFGAGMIVTIVLVLFGFARNTSGDIQAVAACTWIWVLLVGAPIQIYEDGRWAGDAGMLRDATRIPRLIWAGLFSVVAAAALVTSALILVGTVQVPA